MEESNRLLWAPVLTPSRLTIHDGQHQLNQSQAIHHLTKTMLRATYWMAWIDYTAAEEKNTMEFQYNAVDLVIYSLQLQKRKRTSLRALLCCTLLQYVLRCSELSRAAAEITATGTVTVVCCS